MNIILLVLVVYVVGLICFVIRNFWFLLKSKEKMIGDAYECGFIQGWLSCMELQVDPALNLAARAVQENLALDYKLRDSLKREETYKRIWQNYTENSESI